LDGHAAGLIAGRYRMLRGVTTGRRSSLTLIALLTFAIAVLVLVGTANTINAIIILALTSSYILYNRIIASLFQTRFVTFTTRRLDSLSAVELLVITTSLTIFYAFRGIGISLPTAILAGLTSTATFIGYSVRRAIGGSIAVSLVASIPTPITAFALAYFDSDSIYRAAALAASILFLPAALMEIMRYMIDNRLSVRNVGLFQLGQAFFKTLLAGGGAELEKMLARLSDESTVSNDIFILKRESGRPVALVVTEVHPGPFRNVGSSTFPSLVQNTMASQGVDAVVLKGLSGHEKNIADSSEARKLASMLARRVNGILSEGRFTKSITYPRRAVLNGAKTLWWKMAGNTLCLMTLHPNPMEDLPSEIVNGVDSLIPVDTHNCFDNNYRALDRESLQKLKSLVEHLKKNNGADPDEIQVGFSRIIPHEFGPADGMGPGGLSCLVFAGSRGRVGVVVADVNNAVAWVRDLVKTVAERYGVEDVELCTTDTHCVNAVTLGGKGYHPLGEVIPSETLEPILDRLFREALSGMSKAEAAHLRIASRHIVFSNFLDHLLSRISAGTKIYLATLCLTPILVTIFNLLI